MGLLLIWREKHYMNRGKSLKKCMQIDLWRQLRNNVADDV